MQKHLEELVDEAEAERKYSLPNATDAKAEGPLKDCPKCGGREYIVHRLRGSHISVSLPCPSCNADGVRI